MTVAIETEDEHSERMWSVLSLIQKNGTLKKYLGLQVKILGMGLNGPKLEDCEGQGERCQDLRINMAYLCCTKTAELGGILLPNKNFFTKRVSRDYWTVGGRQTTINMEFQNLRDDKSRYFAWASTDPSQKTVKAKANVVKTSESTWHTCAAPKLRSWGAYSAKIRTSLPSE